MHPPRWAYFSLF